MADVLLAGYAARRTVLPDAHPEMVFEVRVPGMRRVRVVGKVDVLLPEGIVEHKTTSKTIEPGSEYMQALAMDGQVSTYLWALGRRHCWYDVIKKPALRGRKDETPEEMAARVELDDSYFALAEVVRTDAEIAHWLEETIKPTIRALRRKDRPQCPARCWDWFRACDYWPLCTGTADATDSRYRVAETAHEEVGR